VEGRDLVELTDEGWRRTTGSAPLEERDNAFLIGLLDALEGTEVQKNNLYVSARDVYDRLGWRWNTGEAHALAGRLERQGLAKSVLTNGDALVRLEYLGVQRAKQLKEEGVKSGQ
jgi:hypothetical protein